MNSPLRIALVGAGKMGRHHATAIQRLPEIATLVAVADTDARFAESAAKDLGIPAWYGSLDELLRKEKPDLVHICTVPQSHAALAETALRGGAHIYMEKPFTETADEAHRVTALATKNGLKVCAGHQLLFERPTLLAKELVPKLGAIQHVESYFAFRQARRADGRTPMSVTEQLLDILPHPVYLLLHFLGADDPARAINVEGLRVDERGTVHGIISCGDATGVLAVTMNGRPVDSFVKVVGTKGAVTLDYVRGILVPQLGEGSTIDKILDPYSRAWATAGGSTGSLARRVLKKQVSYPGLAEAFESFYKHVAHGAPAPVTPTNIERTVELCDLVRERLPVVVPSPAAALAGPVASTHPTVAVTGGTGMLGRAVVDALIEQGVSPLILTRRAPTPGQMVPEAHYQVTDLGSGPFELPAGIETVVHCAAETVGSWDAHQRNSIDATKHLLDAMTAAGAKKLVLVSSLAVIDADAKEPLTEDAPLERDGRRRGAYVWGKLEQEKLCWDAQKTRGIELKVVRPGALVDNGNFDPPGKLGRAIGRTYVAIGSPRTTIPVCDVTMCGEILAWMATHFEDAPAVLHTNDPDAPTRRALTQRVRDTMPGMRVVWFPTPLLMMASLGALALQKVLRPGKPAINLKSVFESPRCDTTRVRQVLDAMEQQGEPVALAR